MYIMKTAKILICIALLIISIYFLSLTSYRIHTIPTLLIEQNDFTIKYISLFVGLISSIVIATTSFDENKEKKD